MSGLSLGVMACINMESTCLPAITKKGMQNEAIKGQELQMMHCACNNHQQTARLHLLLSNQMKQALDQVDQLMPLNVWHSRYGF